MLKGAPFKSTAGCSMSFSEIKSQPSYIGSDQLRLYPYQLDGLNFMYYKWAEQKACILADEMGLGKTIQVVSLLGVIARERGIGPFLVVVPNGTFENWIKEFSAWCGCLVVAPFLGDAADRAVVQSQIMYPDGYANGLCVNIVLTTWEMTIQHPNVFCGFDFGKRWSWMRDIG